MSTPPKSPDGDLTPTGGQKLLGRPGEFLESAVELIRSRLAALEPVRLDIRDDSHQHAGHAGARDGGHYAVYIVAPRFAGLSTMQRHRLVYDAIGDLAHSRIHAIGITAKSPDEIKQP